MRLCDVQFVVTWLSKWGEGVYTINRALNLYDNITLEGGFLPTINWVKASNQGRTVIHRTIANPDGKPNLNQRLVAIQAVGVKGFRFARFNHYYR